MKRKSVSGVPQKQFKDRNMPNPTQTKVIKMGSNTIQELIEPFLYQIKVIPSQEYEIVSIEFPFTGIIPVTVKYRKQKEVERVNLK